VASQGYTSATVVISPGYRFCSASQKRFDGPFRVVAPLTFALPRHVVRLTNVCQEHPGLGVRNYVTLTTKPDRRKPHHFVSDGKSSAQDTCADLFAYMSESLHRGFELSRIFYNMSVSLLFLFRKRETGSALALVDVERTNGFRH